MAHLPRPNRRYMYSDTMDTTNKKYGEASEVMCSPEKANLISSLTNVNSNFHAPVIDFDLPIEVYPSTQHGHNHLYINRDVAWEDYKELLILLVKMGLVEHGFADAAIKKGYTAVRPPGVLKPGVGSTTISEYLSQNAQLRKENYELRAMLEDTLKQLNAEDEVELNSEEDDGAFALAGVASGGSQPSPTW